LVDIEPLRDPSGAVIGLTGAATDITDQKRAQEDLAQTLAFREQVLGILGRDLRNPLSAVRVLATLLLRREDLPEAVRSSLWEIDRSGERMLEMIGTLLDFTESRVKETLPVAPVPMDTHELCQSVVEELLAAKPGLEHRARGRGGRTLRAPESQATEPRRARAFPVGATPPARTVPHERYSTTPWVTP
jgi:signal transduction histidine kinase